MRRHLFDVAGKTALVTGAARGLGLAMAAGSGPEPRRMRGDPRVPG